MEYPLIKVKSGKIMYRNKISRGKEAIELIKSMTKNGMVYVFDIDGYRKNSLNFEVYRKAGKNLWIDAYPRSTEDVMDIIVSGADKITLRDMDEKALKEIKELTDKDIYLSGDKIEMEIERVRKFGFSGIVLHANQNSTEEIETWKIYEDMSIIKRIK